MAELKNQYLDRNGLEIFYNILNGSWWNGKKSLIDTDLSNQLSRYLPLTGGELTGGLTITGDVLPKTSGLYNLGKPEIRNNNGVVTQEGLLWNVYASSVVAESLSVTGQISGNLEGSSSNTKGGLSFGIYNEKNEISEVFNFNGSKNTYLTANNGLIISSTLSDGQYEIGHSNNITGGTTTSTSGAVNYGGKISIPKITYDKHGHITSTTYTQVILPSSDAFVTLADEQTISGKKTFSSQIVSTVTNKAPFEVTSSEKVNNLNADYVDGHDASYFATAAGLSALTELVNGIDNEVGFGKVVIGNNEIEANTHEGTLIMESGDRITLTADTENDKITISTSATADSALLTTSIKNDLETYLGIKIN